MSTCKQCGSTVRWVKDGERKKCLNPDGSDHWDLCSRLRFERIKATGQHFKTKDAEGYRTPLKKSGVAFVHLRAKRRGRSKVRGGCKECSLPWAEPCAECPDRIAERA